MNFVFESRFVLKRRIQFFECTYMCIYKIETLLVRQRALSEVCIILFVQIQTIYCSRENVILSFRFIRLSFMVSVRFELVAPWKQVTSIQFKRIYRIKSWREGKVLD